MPAATIRHQSDTPLARGVYPRATPGRAGRSQIVAPFRLLHCSHRSSIRAVFDPPPLNRMMSSNSRFSREPRHIGPRRDAIPHDFETRKVQLQRTGSG